MLSDVLDEVTAVLSGIAGSIVLTGQAKVAANTAPPRFIWVVLGASPEGGARNKDIGSKTTSALAVDGWRVACHCWGHDFRAAETLRAAAVTAMRKASKGRSYALLDTESMQPGYVTRGHALIVNFDVWVPLEKIALPTLEPETYPTAHVNTVALKTDGAVLGDGELTSGET